MVKLNCIFCKDKFRLQSDFINHTENNHGDKFKNIIDNLHKLKPEIIVKEVCPWTNEEKNNIAKFEAYLFQTNTSERPSSEQLTKVSLRSIPAIDALREVPSYLTVYNKLVAETVNEKDIAKLLSQPKFACEICEKPCLSAAGITTHLNLAHNIKKKDNSKEPTRSSDPVEVIKPVKKSSKMKIEVNSQNHAMLNFLTYVKPTDKLCPNLNATIEKVANVEYKIPTDYHKSARLNEAEPATPPTVSISIEEPTTPPTVSIPIEEPTTPPTFSIPKTKRGSTDSEAKENKNPFDLSIVESEVSIANNYKCEQCNQTFSKQKRLRRHVSEFHNSVLNESSLSNLSGRVVQCQFCGVQFKKQSKLDKHLPICENANACLCETCGLGFSSGKRLSRHIVKSHGPGSPESRACDRCRVSFYTEEQLNYHLCSPNNGKKHRKSSLTNTSQCSDNKKRKLK